MGLGPRNMGHMQPVMSHSLSWGCAQMGLSPLVDWGALRLKHYVKNTDWTRWGQFETTRLELLLGSFDKALFILSLDHVTQK